MSSKLRRRLRLALARREIGNCLGILDGEGGRRGKQFGSIHRGDTLPEQPFLVIWEEGRYEAYFENLSGLGEISEIISKRLMKGRRVDEASQPVKRGVSRLDRGEIAGYPLPYLYLLAAGGL